MAQMKTDTSLENMCDEEMIIGIKAMALTELSTEQLQALQLLKQRLSKDLKLDLEDYDLLKWLKARKFDVEKAEKMFRGSRQFKQEMGVDKITEDFKKPEVLEKYMSGGYCGFDKEGSPIRLELFGSLDMKGIMHSCRRTELVKTKILHCETCLRMCEEQSRKLGKKVDSQTVIFDMEGVQATALWRPGLQMYLHLVSMMEDNYPELMKRLFVVNAPSYLNLFWKICKPLVSEDTKRKIYFCKQDYKEVLLRYIDEDQLPVFLGGAKLGEGGDARCSDVICQGGVVPKELYLSDSHHLLDNMECDVVASGQSLSVTKQVDQPGYILCWEFRTEDHDIGFKVTFREEKGSEERELVAFRRVKAQNIMEDGRIACKETGIYNVIFSNNHSWWTSKLIHHKIDLVKE